jgi:tetratricopeptide (TPR) repeat protein
VKGIPITKFCDQQRLNPRQRLELFVPVCLAVQHAHQKGIIHRDLKPSNVLVALYDDRPVPKVIDFGVAKATGQQLTEQTLHTGFGAIVGTLEYMSPEQASFNQLDVDTRSDIYSLGVLLYELLAGSPPFSRKELEKAGMLEMLRVIREQEPSKPSTKLSTAEGLPTLAARRGMEPKRLTALVRGELDWIVMRALEKDRTRRYETANGFAMDVQRYLADDPVEACPPSAGYRLRKVARRHRKLLLTAATFAALLLLGATVSIWQAVEATRAKTSTRAALDDLEVEQGRTKQALAAETKARGQARRALNSMTDDVIRDLLGKQPQLDDSQRQFLRKVLAFHLEFAQEQGDSEESRAVAADGQFNAAHVQALLGEREAAVGNFLEAIRRRRQLAADFPGVPEYRYQLAQAHLELGVVYWSNEESKKALTAYGEALELFDRLAGEFPAVPEYREGQAKCHNNLGLVLAVLGKSGEAEAAFGRALAIKAQLAADSPADPALRESVARSQVNFGNFLQRIGERPRAQEAFSEALATLEKLSREYPKAHKCRQELGSACINLAGLLQDMGKRKEAEAVARRGMVVLEQLAADFPALPVYRRELAGSHRILGVILQHLRQPSEAEAAYRRALALYEQLVAEFPTVPSNREALAGALNNLGIILMELRRYPEAEAASRRALALDERLAAEFPAILSYRTGLAGDCVNFGNLLRSQKRSQDALEWYDKAIPLLNAGLAGNDRREPEREFLRNAHVGRAQALADLQRHAEAAEHWDQALALVPAFGRPIMRLQKALALARAGDHARATAEVAALTADARGPAPMLYDAACVYSVSLAALKGETDVRDKYAAQALALLGRARDAGFFQDRQQVEHAKKDPDLAPLRSRDDFQKFMAEVEAGQKKQ